MNSYKNLELLQFDTVVAQPLFTFVILICISLDVATLVSFHFEEIPKNEINIKVFLKNRSGT
jgi:hypothetical protein